jgi:hypothetical protein
LGESQRRRRASSPICLSDFLRSPAFRNSGWKIPAEMLSRLLCADIKSRMALLRWARERYPTEYKRYHFLSGLNGREVMTKLWADFLRWAEQ